jgi:hypothetical protein
LQHEHRAEQQRRRVDLGKVQTVIRNACPQPHQAEHTGDDLGRRSSLPKQKAHHQGAKQISDHLRRPDRLIVRGKNGKELLPGER